MPTFSRVVDRWRDLRCNLYGNTEPEVNLTAITCPISLSDDGEYLFDADISKVEELPALAASISYGSTERMQRKHNKLVNLNKKLIEMEHLTPAESIQINLHISGISKTCGAQLSRYRVGTGHVSASRRFKKAEPRFVYPIYDDLEESDAIWEMFQDEQINKFCFYAYLDKLNRCVRKENARQVLPVSYATERSMWVNVRSLRHMFKERLAADTETELRRLAWMIFDIVNPLMPSLFEDITTTNGGD